MQLGSKIETSPVNIRGEMGEISDQFFNFNLGPN